MSYIVYFAWAELIARGTSDMLDKPTSMSLQAERRKHRRIFLVHSRGVVKNGLFTVRLTVRFDPPPPLTVSF